MTDPRPRRLQPLRRSPLPARRATLRRGPLPKRRSELRRLQPWVAVAALLASPEQRAKVAGRPCLVCGSHAVDPAHLIPRSLGGCDDATCVVPLCRSHHRAYDSGELDLLGYLEPVWRVELAHAVLHAGLIGALRRLTGRRDAGSQADAC